METNLMSIRTVLLVLSALLINGAAKALDADIRAKADGGNTPFVLGVTNLPDETRLMVGLRRKEANYFAQAQTTVGAGQFKTERFTALGKPLPPGNYELGITMPLARVQPAGVRTVIGEEGERLTGRLVDKSRFGITLKVVSTVNIGGAPSDAADAAARRDDNVAMEKWRRENCEWIQEVTHSQRPLSECIERLSR
jgi:hypothetical protein